MQMSAFLYVLLPLWVPFGKEMVHIFCMSRFLTEQAQGILDSLQREIVLEEDHPAMPTTCRSHSPGGNQPVLEWEVLCSRGKQTRFESQFCLWPVLWPRACFCHGLDDRNHTYLKENSVSPFLYVNYPTHGYQEVGGLELHSSSESCGGHLNLLYKDFPWGFSGSNKGGAGLIPTQGTKIHTPTGHGQQDKILW